MEDLVKVAARLRKAELVLAEAVKIKAQITMEVLQSSSCNGYTYHTACERTNALP